MTKAAIRNKDSTTTGGFVIAQSSTIFDHNNERVALHGDHATCCNCKGSYPIYGTGQGMSEKGRNVVVEGDLVMCPCKKNRVLRGNSPGIFLHSDNGTPISAISVMQTNSYTENRGEPEGYDEQLRLLSSEGIPFAHLAYQVTLENGATHSGVTDAEGRTQRICTDEKLQIVRVKLHLDGVGEDA